MEQTLICIGDCRVAWASIGLCFGMIIGAITFSWLGERKIKNKVSNWANKNMDESDEQKLLEEIK